MTHSQFTAAVLDPALPAPDGLVGPTGAPAGKRFDVYRNNVAVGLTEALASAYPAVHKLVGDEFFRAMAGVYLRAQPPHSRMMKDFGDRFPRFLLGFEPARSLPYLPDVARLERARRIAYHARDAAPITPQSLADLTPDRLMQARAALTPSAQVIASKHPILAIWRANMQEGPKPTAMPQEVLIARKGFDPVQVELPTGGAHFVEALRKGASLGAALAIAPQGFDFTALLTALLGADALQTLITEAPQ